MSSIIFEKILIVDDSDWDRELLSSRMDSIGLENADTATDKDDALSKLENGNYDLVITDMMMPRPKDGIELIKAMKENGKLKNIPVIVASSANAMASVIEAADAGANGFISKPYAEEELEAAVKMLSNSQKLFSDR